jgi:uncharacterized protein (TIGR02996 family)
MTPEGFLQDIVTHPEDDTPRLVFADWLDEHGDAQRAEFIRVQVELHRLDDGSPRRAELLARQQALLAANEKAWCATLPKARGLGWKGWSRGFPEAVWINSAKVFREQAAAVFAAAPVQDLALGRQVTGRTLQHILASPLLARMTGLNLYHSRVADPGAEAIAACPHLAGLRDLSLIWCGIGPAGVIALARSPYLTGLQKLHLDYNHIGEEGIRALAGSPLLAGIQILHLNSTDAGDAGVLELARSPHVGAVRELWLQRNGIGDVGMRALAASDRLAALESLDLYANRISDDGAAALASKTGLPALSELHLGDNEITTTGALALARGTSLDGLKRLTFYSWSSQSGPEGVAALRERFGERVEIWARDET